MNTKNDVSTEPGQLQLHIASGQLFRLPLEAEWELTACTDDMGRFVDQLYPWHGDRVDHAHLRANLRNSDLGTFCTTGVFAPNPRGIFDLDGNAWEWQNTLYNANGSGKDLVLDRDIKALNIHEKEDQSDKPVLRGKSINQTGEGGRESDRFWLAPLVCSHLIGFRLVLSPAD